MFPYYSFQYPFYVPPYPIQMLPSYNRHDTRQPVRGQVTWTDGGEVTKCNIHWSENNYMTAAVGENSPYHCGEYIRLRNIGSPYGREIVVMVVDEVADYPPNKINLHRRAFEALGVNPNVGVINVEIIPISETETQSWSAHLLHVVRTAFPDYQPVDYQLISKTKVSDNAEKETYKYRFQHGQQSIEITGEIIYDPNTNRIRSIQMKEV